MHHDTSLYSAGCKEKIAVDKVVFWSIVSEMNYKNQEFFCRKYPLLALPFLSHLSLLMRNYDNWYPRSFQPCLLQWLLFFQPVRILKKMCLKVTTRFNSLRQDKFGYLITDFIHIFHNILTGWKNKSHFSISRVWKFWG